MQKLSKGFVRTEGKKIVDGEGKELLLRGVGLGNWLLPEGYMWKFQGKYERPRRIETLLEELIGEDDAAKFWQSFGERYTTEEDVKRIAEEGFNSIRVPMNSRHLFKEVDGDIILDEHIYLVDNINEWCKKYEVYAILDLHGAPGGQTGANIDDSENDYPELFSNEDNKRRTIELWRKLAERYKDEWIVAGYDLLNEPLPQEKNYYNAALVKLYEDMTKAIREIDRKHMIILEGAHWSTDWSIFASISDDNTMLQGHKYWNNPDEESIQHYLKKREELNVPIWLGETGENTIDWFKGNFQLLEDFNIGWNFWPWKKLDTDNSPCSINRPEGWNKVIEYTAGGEKPEKKEAKRIFEEYLDNILIENCTYHKEVVNAIMRRVPLTLQAEFFGYKGEGISYKVNERHQSDVEFRTTEGVKIEFVNDNDAVKLDHLHSRTPELIDKNRLCVVLHEGEWMSYDIDCDSEGEYELKLKVLASSEGSKVLASLDGEELGKPISISADKWSEVIAGNKVNIKAGKHQVKINACSGRIKLDWIEIK